MTAAMAVLVVVVAAWVLRPLFGRRRASVPPADVERSELVEAKHSLYRSILDLEFDRAVGKVAPADYETLRREHEEEAVGILRALDEAPPAAGAAGGDAEALDVLEKEIAAARQRRRGL